MALEGVIELERLDHWLFFGIDNHEISITFTDINTQVKWFHVKASFIGNILGARNHQPCNNTVSCTKLIPNLDLAEGRNSATGSKPKTQPFSSTKLIGFTEKRKLFY